MARGWRGWAAHSTNHLAMKDLSAEVRKTNRCRREREDKVAIDSASRHSRRTVLGILAMALAPMMPKRAHGQAQQTIRLNVPFSPGTGPDLLARILSEELRQRWNQPVIVENKPGA